MNDYKSLCRACNHFHQLPCSIERIETGNMQLTPNSSYDFGSMWYGPKSFYYSVTRTCGCAFYVPKDNLEYFKWLYEQQSQSAVQ